MDTMLERMRRLSLLAVNTSWSWLWLFNDTVHCLTLSGPPPIHPPVRVLLQGLDGLLDVADVPELDLAVVSAAGQVVLAVGVEVQVAHQLAVGVLDTVDLTGEGGEDTGWPCWKPAEDSNTFITISAQGPRFTIWTSMFCSHFIHPNPSSVGAGRTTACTCLLCDLLLSQQTPDPDPLVPEQGSIQHELWQGIVHRSSDCKTKGLGRDYKLRCGPVNSLSPTRSSPLKLFSRTDDSKRGGGVASV
ncbi:hypothetical protein F7725_007794 [Dissostichus mawsoni]|uniref:Uncharacterized protein n=1 Tax=Dissostichus mawsoni TaxID=36200 RepID=A0A7J5Y6G0_DISMA|nr:hypothetical protein F7725_007794 [Dissostichus mawsoni]